MLTPQKCKHLYNFSLLWNQEPIPPHMDYYKLLGLPPSYLLI